MEKIKADSTIAEEGQRLYDRELRSFLEPDRDGQFVAIEPESGRYFLAETGIQALRAAKNEMPDRLFYLVRVGSDTTYRVGSHGTRER